MKKILLALSLVFFGASAFAQSEKEETRTYPYAFVGVQGGVTATLNGYNLSDVLSPAVQAQGGAWWTPALGTRLTVGGWENTVGVKGFHQTYDYKYFNASLDVMINLVNAFTRTDDHLVGVVLFGGVGLNKAWGHEYRDIAGYAWDNTPTAAAPVGSYVHNHLAHNDRVGVMVDFRFGQCRNWGVGIEAQFNHIGSRSYAMHYNSGKEWTGSLMAGVTYYFGKCKAAPQPVVVPAPQPVAQEKPAPAPKPEPKPAVEKKPEPKPQPKKLEEMKEVIFYVLRGSDAQGGEEQKIAAAANWLKAHPTAKATVSGYADKGTGTAEVNVKYAEKRAQDVKTALVEKYGVAADRLTVRSYGDTVQPFDENDKNRCVIIVAKEQ